MMKSITAFFNHARFKIRRWEANFQLEQLGGAVIGYVVKASLPLHRTAGLLILWFPKGQGRGDGTGTAVELNP